MKHAKTTAHTHLTWFDHNNRRHVSFMIAISLIAILFIAAIIGILSGRYKPFADIINNNRARMMTLTTKIPAGRFTYKDDSNATKNVTGSTADVTIKALAHGGVALQGAGDRVKNMQKLEGKLTIVMANAELANSNNLRNLVWSTTTKKGDTAFDIAVNSDTYRTYADKHPEVAKFDAIVKPNFYLAKKVPANSLRLIDDATYLAGDTTNDNTVNGGDFAKLVSKYGQTVDINTEFDVTKDGQVNGADFAVLVSNYGKSGEPL